MKPDIFTIYKHVLIETATIKAGHNNKYVYINYTYGKYMSKWSDDLVDIESETLYIGNGD